ncbi:Uncharacterised protein [Mycobacteroides abscessus subsp. abscessus]|nr:Uncharacterised protein [Mycobacteroides abscessus subsp. abscessus]
MFGATQRRRPGLGLKRSMLSNGCTPLLVE